MLSIEIFIWIQAHKKNLFFRVQKNVQLPFVSQYAPVYAHFLYISI